MCRISPLVLLAACLACACGGQVVTQRELSETEQGEEHSHAEHPPADCVAVLGAKPTEHACQHAGLGPFVELVALENASKAPDMSRVHHTYRFLMQGQVPPYRGFATFRGSRAGAQAFMRPLGVRLAFHDGDQELPVVDARVEACSMFPESSVVNTASGRSYLVEFSSSTREFDVFVEHLEAFAAKAWAKTCN